MHLFTSKALRTQHYLLMPSLMALLSILFISPPATAGRPVIRIMPSTQGSNQISIAAGQTQTVTYLIESALGKPSHWTWSNLSNYLSKVPSVSQPDCAATTFTLAAHGSCYFTIAIDGTGFSSAYQGHPINDGPIFASSALLAYKPSPENQLVISKASHLAAPITIFAGAYNDGHVTRPLISISTDKGLTWNFPNTPNEVIFTPANTNPFSAGQLNSAFCNSEICISAGTYTDGVIDRPLLAKSIDRGVSWVYPTNMNDPVFTPANTNPFLNSGGLFGGACDDSICIAAGTYIDLMTVRRPLIALSTDHGQTFSYPDLLTSPIFTPANTYPFSDNGYFSKTSCSANLCIAAGYYLDSMSTTRPLLVETKDKGATWSFPESITAPFFIPGNSQPFVDNGKLLGTGCSGSTCVAAGFYSTGVVQLPMAAVSNDAGLTWTYPESVTQVIFSPANPNPFVDSGRLGGVSCSGTLCVAAGSYNDGTTKRPLLAFSNDSGQTWTYPAATNAPVFSPVNLHPFVNSGEFWDGALSCSGTTCVAGGQYFDGTILRPMLAVTSDSGATWTFPASVTELNFSPSATHPFGGTYAEFYAVNCSGSVCTAGGSYNDGVAERPMIGVSQDSGLTWTFPDAVTSPIFTPLNTNPFVENGWFNEAGGTAGLRFWPDSLDFLLN